jgi:hypothetical protein
MFTAMTSYYVYPVAFLALFPLLIPFLLTGSLLKNLRIFLRSCLLPLHSQAASLFSSLSPSFSFLLLLPPPPPTPSSYLLLLLFF